MSDDFEFGAPEEDIPELTKEELIEIREAFFAFSREDRVRPYVLRALGIIISEEETDAIIQQCMNLVDISTSQDEEDDRPPIVTLEQLNQVLRGKMPDALSESQIYMAFAIFDPMGNGYIETEELKRCLNTYGDKMSKKEKL